MKKIGIIGLGYVGLPLAVEFGKKRQVVGFDIDIKRIKELKSSYDSTSETSIEDLKSASLLSFSSKIDDIKDVEIFIITVPTPIDSLNKPDLSAIKKSSSMVANILKKGDIVIYESTVYPGATEEVCVPILEKNSGLKFNIDFFCGYSPERINPGDKEHRVFNIRKVTSGSLPEIAIEVDNLYKEIIIAGTYLAKSIKVAEAAKVIENTQRDVNIALINELALIFNKLNIDTEEVLNAAGTKWNFLPFRPGLVGGHCIGVDPYYLTYKAIEVGYYPKMILAGREINDNMGLKVVKRVLDLMRFKNIPIDNSNVLIMGFTFKENCPDFRNTKVIDICKELQSLNMNIDIFDPLVSKAEVQKSFGLNVLDSPSSDKYDAIILTVPHNEFKDLSIEDLKSYAKDQHVIFDVKYLFKIDEVDGRL